MSTLKAVVERRETEKTNSTDEQHEQGGGDEQNPELPQKDPATKPVVEPISSEEAREENPDPLVQKCFRDSSGAHSETYVPSLNIRSSNSIILRAPKLLRV